MLKEEVEEAIGSLKAGMSLYLMNYCFLTPCQPRRLYRGEISVRCCYNSTVVYCCVMLSTVLRDEVEKAVHSL